MPRALALLAFVGALSVADAQSAAVTSDPLARSEFDAEISIDAKDGDVVNVFRFFAKATQIPFVLDFEEAPELRLTLEARNMSIRAILASLASTYDLTYSMSSDGVVVRRTGGESVANPLTVGGWPRGAGASYELALQVRDPKGRVLSRVPLTTRVNQAETFKQGLPGDGEVLTLDEQRGLLEPAYVAGLEIRIYLKGEAPDGLDLLLELVTSRVLGPDRYVQERHVTTRTVGKGGATLFRTEDGFEIALTGWRRKTDGADGQ